MKKNDLNKLALIGISAGIVVVSQPNAHADEVFSNTVSGQYLAGGCGSKCSVTAANDRGYSNQGYFFNQDQNQTYYYQQNPSESNRLEQSTRQKNRNQPQQYNNQQPQYNQGYQNQPYWQGSYNNPGYLSSNDETLKEGSPSEPNDDEGQQKR